jgi:hypothetical protein
LLADEQAVTSIAIAAGIATQVRTTATVTSRCVNDRASLLDREVSVLAERLRQWTARRWRAAAPPYETRAEAGFHLAQRFAALAESPAALPWVADYAIADQIAVTGHDLAAAEPGDDVLEAALDELRRTRELLEI